MVSSSSADIVTTNPVSKPQVMNQPLFYCNTQYNMFSGRFICTCSYTCNILRRPHPEIQKNPHAGSYIHRVHVHINTYWFSLLSEFCHFRFPSTITLSYQMTFDPGHASCIPVESRERNVYSWSMSMGWKSKGRRDIREKWEEIRHNYNCNLLLVNTIVIYKVHVHRSNESDLLLPSNMLTLIGFSILTSQPSKL